MKLSRISIISLWLCLMFFFFAHDIFAVTVFTDNFDDADITDWELTGNQQYFNPTLPCMNGSIPAQWQAWNGMAGIVIQGPVCATGIKAKNLDLSNATEYVLDFDWYFPESINMDRTIAHVWRDTQNWYDIRILDNTLLMQKAVGGKLYQLANNFGTYPFRPNNIQHFSIHVWTNQRYTVDINGVRSLDVLDTAPTMPAPKTIALEAGVGAIFRSVSYFDNITVQVVAETQGKQLNVPLLKQTDTRWKNEEYDSANSWSTSPTIKRWGCALTSMTMILRYYGITSLPLGDDLNPGTLNAWLKSQKDGYLPGGALNWVAITRLTKLMSEIGHTPKLEYQYRHGSLENAMKEIQNDRPVIIEILGHFLVGDGITPDTLSLWIKDPAYAFTKFSQHKTDILSLRSFIPSHTDLSYIVIPYSPDLHVSLKNMQGQPVENTDIFTESIIDPIDNSGETTPQLIQQYIAKPQTSQYLIEVNRSTSGPYTLNIFAYDQGANPTLFQQTGFVGTIPVSFILDYHKDGPSKILFPKISFTQIRRDLQTLYDIKQITSTTTFRALDKFVQNAEQVSPKEYPRYISGVLTLMQQYGSGIKSEAQAFLKKQLSLVK